MLLISNSKFEAFNIIFPIIEFPFLSIEHGEADAIMCSSNSWTVINTTISAYNYFGELKSSLVRISLSLNFVLQSLKFFGIEIISLSSLIRYEK